MRELVGCRVDGNISILLLLKCIKLKLKNVTFQKIIVTRYRTGTYLFHEISISKIWVYGTLPCLQDSLGSLLRTR